MQKIQNRNFPVFVKPANLGSSVGISKVENIEGIEDAVNRAAIFDRKILVEDGITGREIEISVLGNEEPVTSLAGEIVSRSEFYDYEEKYIKDTAELIMPAELSDDLLERARSIAMSAYQAIDASGLARADMFITEDDRVLINELNTMPGFTSISMYPKLWELSGIPYKDLIQRLIDLAMERHDQRRAIKTDRSAP
jgi:D-alanine-D-alanine ligase